MISRSNKPVRLRAVRRGSPDRRGIRRGVSLLPSLFTLANRSTDASRA
jgi:hypothetical protein